MAKLYADLIKRNLWTLEQVPPSLKDEVKNILNIKGD